MKWTKLYGRRGDATNQPPHNSILKGLACNADLGTRPYISLMAMGEIEDDTEDYNASIHDARPVHGHCCDRN